MAPTARGDYACTHQMSDALEPARLPHGRLRYRWRGDPQFVIVVAARLGGHWIVEDGWSKQSRCAGPFLPNEALRALRLSNTYVPNGCELGPWQLGLELFSTGELPAHPQDWSRFAPAWLPPGVSFYRSEDLDVVVNESCCAPPTERPTLIRGEAPGYASNELEALVRGRSEGTALEPRGVLGREWNAHPTGSPVWAAAEGLERGFAVVDLPPEP